jgi:hypothetical protein
MIVNINLETWPPASGLDGLANPWPQRKTKVPAIEARFFVSALERFLGERKYLISIREFLT